ncbi:hypothetical protein CE91St44_13070 [Oscillospiraceae bacterium]|nr:hypothetical protein CE91St44_13070 [Oscillospiraceae bacterium]
MRKIYAIGNAHLDAAWLWPWQEGYAEVKATFRSALQRLEEYEGFVFTSSSAQYYAWLEEAEPEMLDGIRTYIRKGRWVICGGWWVQPDCNLPCGEALIRQGLWGQTYFRETLGTTATVGYNVDSFGHSSALPQILRGSGMDAYVFLRPGPHEKTLPGSTFWWEGPDGSRVMAYRIPQNYSANLDLEAHIAECAKQFEEEPENPAFMLFYGVGNHGGGPTRRNIETLLRPGTAPAGFKLGMSSPAAFFKAQHGRAEELPVHKGELQHHAPGCYSAHSGIKAANYQAENALLRAEKFAALGAGMLGIQADPALENAWGTVLFDQFHDILAGCAIPAVYESALNELGGAAETAHRQENRVLQALSFRIHIPYEDDCVPLVLFNPHPWPVRALVTHERGSWGNPGFPQPCGAVDSGGRIRPCQFVATAAQLEERQCAAFIAELPPLGWETYRILPAGAGEAQGSTGRPGKTPVLENEFLRVVFDPATGLPCEMTEKMCGAQPLCGPCAQAAVYRDLTDTWGHGAKEIGTQEETFVLESVRVTENGPVLQRVRTVSSCGACRIIQDFTLLAGDARLYMKVRLLWLEQRACCKLLFPTGLQAARAVYGQQFGQVERPLDGLEQPMQNWADLSGRAGGQTCGLAVLAGGKYAASARKGRLALTVCRSPAYAHHAPFQLSGSVEEHDWVDQGWQEFCCVLVAHGGDWRGADMARRALELAQPPVKIPETFHPGPLPQRYSGAELPEKIVMTALKPAHRGSGYILRAYESEGAAVQARLELPLFRQTLNAAFAPHQIRTWRLDPTGGMAAEQTNLIERGAEQSEE